MYIPLHSKNILIMKSYSILAVQKITVEHAWFNLVTTNNQHLTVYDGLQNINWDIDNTMKTPTITVWETDDSEQITRSTITGTKEQIENLMWSIGYAIPNKANDSVYLSTISELERSLRTILYDLQELKAKQDA